MRAGRRGGRPGNRGFLLSDAVRRGEVRLDAPVSTYLTELAGTPAGGVTLAELVSHRGGLPPIARQDYADLLPSQYAGTTPREYTDSTPESVIAATKGVELVGRGAFHYSNLGAALLGHALARAGGVRDWPTYVRQRLWEPLGMTATQVAPANTPASDLVVAHSPGGVREQPWTGAGGYAPAGLGVTTTTADLETYARAILDGRIPGADALTPRWDAEVGGLPPMRIGLAWITLDAGGHPWAWHNGGTGGFRTILLLDRDAHRAAIMLSNTAQDPTFAAFRLLGSDAMPPTLPGSVPYSAPFALVAALAALLFAWSSVRGRHRLKLVGRGGWALGTLALWWVAASWDMFPAWMFGAAAGLVAGAAVAAGVRWKSLPWWPAKRRPLAAIAAAIGVVVLVACLAFAVVVAVAAAGVRS